MSKGFKGRTCVYCGGDGISETADHVFAREFLPVEHRSDLPKVPACNPCNNAKSELEHYLTAVLPFGGRHALSLAMLTSDVPRRLGANRKLHLTLAAFQQRIWSTEDGISRRTLAIPFEGEKLGALFALVTKGLAAHHFGVVIPSEYFVGAGALPSAAEPVMESLLAMNAKAKVVCSIGDGLMTYKGAQAVDDPFLTVWRYQIYGGVKLSDVSCPSEMPDKIWASSTRLRSESVFSL